jgi:putative copper export protein
MIISSALLFAEPDFTIVDVLREYIGFVGSFFIVGAAAFYFWLLRPALGDHADVMRSAARMAARVGAVGAVLLLVDIAMSANHAMAEHNLTFAEALTQRPSTILATAVTIVAFLAFAMATRGAEQSRGAWIVAGTAMLVIAFRGLITTDLGDIVNPIHVFAASLWIGTLFVLVLAGISTALSPALAPDARGPAVAVMVNRFSSLALWSARVLVLSGVTTAYLHLKHLSALWTSEYGQTLIVKLCVVACVFAAGAYNNKRMKPSLGTEASGVRMRRSAVAEIALAAVVLGITALLVNLPTPGPHTH